MSSCGRGMFRIVMELLSYSWSYHKAPGRFEGATRLYDGPISQADLHVTVTRKKPFLKKCLMQSHSVQKHTWKVLIPRGKRCYRSDETQKKKVTLLNWTLSGKFGFCQTHQTEAWWWQHSIVGVSLQWGLANWSGLKGKWMLLSTPKSLRKTCLSLLHSWRWAGRSSSNMTTILNIPPAEQRSALKDCQVRVLDFDPIQKSVDGLWEQSFAAHHRIWFNFNNSAGKNWQKLP